MKANVFSGIKVADFSWAGVGPLITKYLADFGATVVRIESPRHPDTLRVSAPYADRVPGMDRSGYFALINGNKYSIGLNLDHQKGLEVAKRLTGWAGVVVESFKPGVMARHGLDYESLKRNRPDIIMLSTSNQGQTGPYAKQVGFGFQVEGLVGFPLLTGQPDGAPMAIPAAYTDYVAFQFGAAALISGLIHRQDTGKGAYFDLSQVEASLHFLSPVMLDWAVNGRAPARMGNASPSAVPHGVYRCKGEDQWCTIAVTNDGEWRAFVKAIGSPDWAADSRFSTFLSRKQNELELNNLVEAWTMGFTPREASDTLQSAGVPSAVVADGDAMVNDPQLKARGYYWELDHPELGTALTVSQPFKLSRTPAEGRMAAPCLGEHTEMVCREMLGMSDAEFIDLVNSGCFESA